MEIRLEGKIKESRMENQRNMEGLKESQIRLEGSLKMSEMENKRNMEGCRLD